MFLPYRGHSISTIPWRLPTTKRWRAKLSVHWNEGAILKTQHFECPFDGFGSEEKADLWAIALGRKWIDDGKPDLTTQTVYEIPVKLGFSKANHQN